MAERTQKKSKLIFDLAPVAAALDDLHDFVIIFNNLYQIEYLNKIFQRGFGKPLIGMVGLPIAKISFGGKLNAVMPQLVACRGGTGGNFPLQTEPDTEGRYMWDISFTPLATDKPGENWTLAVIRDVSELEELGQKAAKAFDANPMISSITTLDEGRYVDVNRAFVVNTGFSREELIGHKSSEIGIWPDTGFREAFVSELKHHGRVSNLAGTYRRKDGTLRDLKVWAELIDHKNEPCLLGVFTDVTEENRVHKALAESESDLRSILTNLADTFYRTDADGKIVMVSKSITNLLGYEPHEVIGKNIASLYVNPADRELFTRELEAKGGHYNDYTTRLRHKNGHEVWVLTNTISRIDDDGCLIGTEGISRDITDRRRRDQQLRDAKQHAEIANKAKTEFLATMSHEFRTPLNAIIGFSQLLESSPFGPLGDERYQDYIKSIQISGELLSELVDETLDIAMIETDHARIDETTVSIAEVVDATARIIQARAQQSKVEFSTKIDAPIPDLWCDKRHLKQILVNLASNAVKFTPAGGRARLLARLDPCGEIVFEVSDTGIGISQDDFDRVVEPFIQLNTNPEISSNQGIGLGLAITTNFIKLHNGTFHIDSEPGHGTTVTVTFPADRTRPRD